MKRFRLRRVSLGGAMALMAILTLVMALIVQTRRAARYQAEVARLRKMINPNWLTVLDAHPDYPDNRKP